MLSCQVQWPAMLKYEGDDELVFVLDESQWLADRDLSGCHYDVADYLVDSGGQKFQLPVINDAPVIPANSGQQLTIDQAVDLIRNHFSVGGACCISKIQAHSISECLVMLQQDNV